MTVVWIQFLMSIMMVQYPELDSEAFNSRPTLAKQNWNILVISRNFLEL